MATLDLDNINVSYRVGKEGSYKFATAVATQEEATMLRQSLEQLDSTSSLIPENAKGVDAVIIKIPIVE